MAKLYNTTLPTITSGYPLQLNPDGSLNVNITWGYTSCACKGNHIPEMYDSMDQNHCQSLFQLLHKLLHAKM